MMDMRIKKKECNFINDKQLEILHKQIHILHNLCELQKRLNHIKS